MTVSSSMTPFFVAVGVVLVVTGATAAPVPSSSSSSSLPTSRNVCAPEDLYHQTPDSCNTCEACCSYLKPQSLCDSCVAANCGKGTWPGPAHLSPELVFFEQATLTYDWHDVAGALTHRSPETNQLIHHVMMGGEHSYGGWAHYISNDLVHWEFLAGAPRKIEEHYEGMASYTTPCSGFLTLDDDGHPCAGFRQCGSYEGLHGGNPWDAPMEVRCSLDDDMTQWTDSEYLFDYYYFRWIPYDPARPWVDEDGKWYMLVSADGCNSTTRSLPCNAGGRLDMFTSPKLRGPGANWTYVGPMFESNKTVLDVGLLTQEFVTIEYVGGFRGDPDHGDTRVFFNNVGGNGGGQGCCSGTTGYFLGKQKNGSKLDVDFSKSYSMGMVDWGSFSPIAGSTVRGVQGLSGTGSRGFSMARTLGEEDPNQVVASHSGRRVIIGWLSSDTGVAALSTPRDLTLDSGYNLLQQFVPEMKMLRNESRHAHIVGDSSSKMSPVASLQAEIVASFRWTAGTSDALPKEFGIAVFGSADGKERTLIGVRLDSDHVIVDSTGQGNCCVRAGPVQYRAEQKSGTIDVHVLVDHSIVQVIFNNVTAITATASPSSPQNNNIFFYGVDGKHIHATADIWELESANVPMD